MKITKWDTKAHDSSMSLEELKALIKRAEDENWESFTLSAYSFGYDGTELQSHFSRPETDEEYYTRIGQEEKTKAAKSKKTQASLLKKREADRKLYEKLKAQFGDK